MNVKSPNHKQTAEDSPAALSEVNARYQLLMDLCTDGIIIVQDGFIRESNRSMAQM